MTPAPSPHRTGRTAIAVIVVLVLAVIASACDSGAAWVAKVDGQTIQGEHFAEGVVEFAKVSGAPAEKTRKDVAPVTDAAQYALFLVQYQLLQALNEKHGTDVTDTQRDEMRQSLLASPQGASLKDTPPWFLDQLVDVQAQFQALIHYYGARVDVDAQTRKYYDDNKDQFRQVCMDVIGSADKAELDAAKVQLTDGSSDFATVAKAIAAQQPPDSQGNAAQAMGEKADGDVGCVPMSNVTPLFASPNEVTKLTEASANALVGPLPVAGGAYMLFRVRKVQVEPYEQVKSAIQQKLGPAGSAQAQQKLNEFLQNADIELNPRYGTWTKGKGYAPPKGAEHPEPTQQLPLSLGGAR